MGPLYGLIWDPLTIKPKYNPKHKEIIKKTKSDTDAACSKEN
jgi:hypothetical protein